MYMIMLIIKTKQNISSQKHSHQNIHSSFNTKPSLLHWFQYSMYNVNMPV